MSLSPKISGKLSFLLKVLLFTAIVLLETQLDSLAEQYAFFAFLQKRIIHLDAILVFITFWMVIDLLRVVILYIYWKRNKQSKEHEGSPNDNFTLGIGYIATLLNLLILILSIFLFFNINIREVITSLSIVAAAIALITKDYIANVINGMILMFSNQLSIGDNVKIGDIKGKITDISLLHVRLLNDEDVLVYIPNNTVFTATIINFTKRTEEKVSIEFEISYEFLPGIAALERYLIEALADYEAYILPQSYFLRTEKIQESAVLLKFQYILRQENKEVERTIRRITARGIVDFIKAQKNSLPPSGESESL
jgi:small-conductance mechanosensitive channel